MTPSAGMLKYFVLLNRTMGVLTIVGRVKALSISFNRRSQGFVICYVGLMISMLATELCELYKI